jgi:outer membrane protein assembly factor BamB
VPRTNIAKVNALTGAVDPFFTASAGNFVSDFLIWGTKLYVVGEFGQVNGVVRRGAALVNTTTGALDPTFNPGADLRVNTVAMNPAGTSLYLGGVFQNVGGTARTWIAEVNPVTGKVQGPSFSNVKDYVRDVTVSPDGKLVYAAVGGGMNSVVAMDTKSGKQKWRQHADGDVQAVKYSNGYVYFGFHDGFGGDTAKRILAANPQTGALNAGFAPESGAYPGVLSIDADGSFLAVGGYFNRMGGRGTVAGVSIHPG